LTRVHQAVQECLRTHLDSAEAVIQRTRTLAAIAAAMRGDATPPAEPSLIPHVQVPLPDLSRFNQLMSDSSTESPVSVFFA
jgi:hypothetical protein